MLAALTAFGDRVRRDLLAAAVLRHAGRTSTLSAALLGCAADGQGLPELTRLLTAVVRGAPVAEQRRALTALLVMGTELNLDLLAGMGFPRPDGAGPNDLVIAVRATDEAALAAGRDAAEAALTARATGSGAGTAGSVPG